MRYVRAVHPNDVEPLQKRGAGCLVRALGTVRAHHAHCDLTERHAGKRVMQERIEGQCLSVGSAFARHHLPRFRKPFDIAAYPYSRKQTFSRSSRYGASVKGQKQS